MLAASGSGPPSCAGRRGLSPRLRSKAGSLRWLCEKPFRAPEPSLFVTHSPRFALKTIQQNLKESSMDVVAPKVGSSFVVRRFTSAFCASNAWIKAISPDKAAKCNGHQPEESLRFTCVRRFWCRKFATGSCDSMGKTVMESRWRPRR